MTGTRGEPVRNGVHAGTAASRSALTIDADRISQHEQVIEAVLQRLTAAQRMAEDLTLGQHGPSDTGKTGLLQIAQNLDGAIMGLKTLDLARYSSQSSCGGAD